MNTTQEKLLHRIVALALAMGVAMPALVLGTPPGERDDKAQDEKAEKKEDKQDKQGKQGKEDKEDREQGERSRRARDDAASQSVPSEVQQGRQDVAPQPNPRALEVRQSEEAHARNVEREAQREAARLQREAEQNREQSERQATQDPARQQRQAEQSQQVQAEQQREVERARMDQQRQSNQLRIEEQRQAEQGRQAVQRQEDQRRLEQRTVRDNPRETPVLRDRLPEPERQRLISQQRQSAEQYRREVAASQEAERQRIANLQRQRRTEQYRYQQSYWDRQRELQSSWSSRRIDYDRDPYFYTAPNLRYQRGGRYYQVNRYAAQVLQQAVRHGYEEGVRAGEADRYDSWRGGYRNNYVYLDANFGYDGYYVSRSEYRYYFREGFRRGYEDGYGRRQRYGRYRNGEYLILSTVLELILRLEPFH